jgi:hypothetical protein
MRPFAALVAFVAFAAPSHAQILKIALKDPKILKQYKSAVMNVDGEQVLVGEHKSGLTFSEKQITYPGNGTFDIWIPDTENPKWCPYKVSKGEKSSAGGGKTSVQIAGQNVKSIGYLIKEQSLWGLSQEYVKRLGDLDGLKKARDAASKGTQDWNRKEASLIQAMDRLKSWLDQTCFAKAAEKYGKEIEKEVKAQKEAKDQRLANAKASIKIVPALEEVVHIAKEAYGDSVVIHQQESQHCRIIYKEEVGDERVKGLLEFAETLIDGFRVLFIDPYIAEDYKDYVPDGMFVEWCFVPDDIEGWKKFTNKYYGEDWAADKHAEERLKGTGLYVRRGKEPSYQDPQRTSERADLDGIIAHTLGHHLVDIHYNQNRNNGTGAWLHEAVGNWLSLEYLGRNNVTCTEFRDLEYAKRLLPEGEKSDELLKGTADLYHRLALDKGRALDLMCRLKLIELEDADIAKSYSLFCFVAKTQGEKGQRWLRSCLNAEAQPNTFVQQWRKKSEEIFGITNQDIFKVMDELWHKFAEQQVGGPIKK